MTKSITGKSLICKEKCIQTAEKERYLKERRLKLETDPVFFISMVSLASDIYGRQMYGTVDEHEHLFDIYSKLYNEHRDFGISFLDSLLRSYFTNNLDI